MDNNSGMWALNVVKRMILRRRAAFNKLLWLLRMLFKRGKRTSETKVETEKLLLHTCGADLTPTNNVSHSFK